MTWPILLGANLTHCNALSKLLVDFCNLSLPDLGVESLNQCCCCSTKSFIPRPKITLEFRVYGLKLPKTLFLIFTLYWILKLFWVLEYASRILNIQDNFNPHCIPIQLSLHSIMKQSYFIFGTCFELKFENPMAFVSPKSTSFSIAPHTSMMETPLYKTFPSFLIQKKYFFILLIFLQENLKYLYENACFACFTIHFLF